MIVDDEPDVLKLIQSLAEPLGCHILPFLDSQEAAEHVHDEKFDGIITDVQMPHLDGFELAKRIRSSALNRTTPIIMLTGHDDVDTMRQGFRVGATCFLGKPIDRDRFSALLKAMRGSMLAERRRYARLPYRTRVKCKPGPHFDQQFVASTLTISEGGLSLEPSGGGLENGQELEMEFQMTGLPMPLKFRGRVVRKEPSEPIGIEFIGPSQKDREAIRRYVEEGVKL
jgi:CheY-like chemotaxis protein